MDDLWYYYCGGTRTIELIVSLHSLRKHYKGRVAVALDSVSASTLPPLPNDVESVVLPTVATTGYEHMAQRWRGLKQFTYDRVIGCDMDTVIKRNPETLFPVIYDDPTYLTTYTGFVMVPSETFFLRNTFRELKPDYIDPGQHVYIHMGIFGLLNGYPHIDEMIKLCPIFGGKRCAAEEYAIAWITQRNGFRVHCPQGDAWVHKDRQYRANPCIWHIIRSRFLKAGQWHKAYREARADNYMGLADNQLVERLCPGISKIIP